MVNTICWKEFPHIGLHISVLADGNIHNVKLINRYIPNIYHPVKTVLTFCGVYHGNSPDIKSNSFKHLIEGCPFICTY